MILLKNIEGKPITLKSGDTLTFNLHDGTMCFHQPDSDRTLFPNGDDKIFLFDSMTKQTAHVIQRLVCKIAGLQSRVDGRTDRILRYVFTDK